MGGLRLRFRAQVVGVAFGVQSDPLSEVKDRLLSVLSMA